MNEVLEIVMPADFGTVDLWRRRRPRRGRGSISSVAHIVQYSLIERSQLIGPKGW